jgi:hypothetical protein
MRLRQRVIDERSNTSRCWKNSSPQKLVIGILDPPLAQNFIGQIVGVLEDRQPRHQARRQRRPPGVVVINLAEPPFQKAPVHGAPQRHKRMLHVDDLIEPGAEKILLPVSMRSGGRIELPRQCRFEGE